MSESGKIKEKVVRSAIPRPKSDSTKDDTAAHGQSTNDVDTTDKHTEKQREVKSARRSIGVDKDKPKSGKSSVSLQGPFKPSVVATMRQRHNSDEHKRKRGEGVAANTFLPSVRSMEDLSPKRNPAKETFREKTRCKVEFSNKVDTKFQKNGTVESDKKTVTQFTAKGKPPVKGYRELKRSEDELHGRVLQLQVDLSQLQLSKDQEINMLQDQLDQAHNNIDSMEKEMDDLRHQMADKETKYREELEEQAKTFGTKNQNLQDRVETCIKKLQQCDIDPVTLESLDPDEEEKEELAKKREQAAKQAKNLKVKLMELNEKNKKLLLNMKTLMEEESEK